MQNFNLSKGTAQRAFEETATRLLELSSKAKENGENYALMTAKNAADTV
jgi:hypothetical protein